MSTFQILHAIHRLHVLVYPQSAKSSLPHVYLAYRETRLDLAIISKTFIHQLIQKRHVQTLVDILKLSPESWKDVGIQQKEVQSYFISLRKPKSLEQLIIALGIPGVGKSLAAQMVNHITELDQLYSDQLSEEFINITNKKLNDLQTYVGSEEIKALIEFLTENVPTSNVGTLSIKDAI